MVRSQAGLKETMTYPTGTEESLSHKWMKNERGSPECGDRIAR